MPTSSGFLISSPNSIVEVALQVLDLSGHGFAYDPATQRVGPFGAHIRGKVGWGFE